MLVIQKIKQVAFAGCFLILFSASALHVNASESEAPASYTYALAPGSSAEIENVSKDFTVGISGNTSDGTFLTDSGVLYVGDDEGAEYITIHYSSKDKSSTDDVYCYIDRSAVATHVEKDPLADIVSEVSVKEEKETIIPANTSRLREAMESARLANRVYAKKEDIERLDASLTIASKVLADENVSQEAVDAAATRVGKYTEPIVRAEEELSPRSPLEQYFPFILAGVVAAAAVVVLLILKKFGILHKPVRKTKEQKAVGKVKAPKKKMKPEAIEDDGAEGTSLLSQVPDAGEDGTSVLASVHAAELLRVDTGERIPVTKNGFRIGKERKKVDYCISGDPSVSRVHCEITCKNGAYYITDNKSTNGTYVDMAFLEPKKETFLHDKAKIRLAEKEFVFMLKETK